MEAGLRLGGYGYPTGFFIGTETTGVYRTNEKFGWRFLTQALARESTPAQLCIKPAGTIRIFILGSSAAHGFPEPSFSFGRILEVILRERYPGARFEIINTAMTAINSHVCLKIAQDCANHQPDMFILYMGNNEVVGPYGPGTVFRQWSPSLRIIRCSLWAKSTHVGQLVEAAMVRFTPKDESPTEWRGMAMFLGKTVAADDPRLAATYGNFRQNLEDICSVAHRAGAAVVLSTVVVNLKDCPPLASLHRSSLLPADLRKWKLLYEEGSALEASGKRTEAIEKYNAAAQIDDRFAELQYCMGRCLAAEGMLAEAQARFVLARDLDALRFRADSHINAIIREVATPHQVDGITLADTERVLAASDNTATVGEPGEEMFYEHVHPTFDGNYRIASILLDRVGDALPQLAEFRKEGPIPSRQQCAELLAYTPYDDFKTRETALKLTTARPPFTDQFDHAGRVAAETHRVNNLLHIATTPEALRSVWKSYEAALAKAPGDWQLHRRLGNLAAEYGRADVAVEQRRIVVDMLPWEPWAHCELGVALEAQGRGDEAVMQYREALRLKPSLVHTISIQSALAKALKANDAIERYVQALQNKPDDPQSHMNLGNELRRVGRVTEAIGHYEQALRIKPDYTELHYNLAMALDRTGKLPEAVRHYTEAVRLNSNCTPALNNLAWIRATNPDPQLRAGAEAVRLAEHACQLTGRKEVGALDTLAAAYAETGRFAVAVATEKEALALAKSAKQSALTDEIQSRLVLYRAGRPYQEVPRPACR